MQETRTITVPLVGVVDGKHGAREAAEDVMKYLDTVRSDAGGPSPHPISIIVISSCMEKDGARCNFDRNHRPDDMVGVLIPKADVNWAAFGGGDAADGMTALTTVSKIGQCTFVSPAGSLITEYCARCKRHRGMDHPIVCNCPVKYAHRLCTSCARGMIEAAGGDVGLGAVRCPLCRQGALQP